MPVKRLADKQEEIREARIHLVRYYAFTNVIEYFNAEKVCIHNGFRKKDITESTQYYIEKGWLKGEALKPYGTSISNCKFNLQYQCAIIAHCPISATEGLQEDMKSTLETAGWTRFRIIDEEKKTLKISLVLNAYCRCHPETLSLFPDMDDLPTEVPDSNEQKLAQERWEEMTAEFSTEDIASVLINQFFFILDKPEFSDFFRSMPENLIRCLIIDKARKYGSFEMLSDETYDLFLNMTQSAKRPKDQPAYDETYDHVLFYQHFLKHGHIDEHLRQMHEHTLPYTLLSAIKFLQSDNANDAVKIIEKHLKLKDSILFEDDLANFIYLIALQKSDTAAAMKTATSLSKKKAIKDIAAPFVRLMLEMKAHPETDFSKWVIINAPSRYYTELSHALFVLMVISHGYVKSLDGVGMQYASKIKECQFRVLALDFAQAISDLNNELPKLEAETQMHPLLGKVHRKEAWEQVIDTIMQKYGDGKEDSSKKPKKEVVEMARVSYLINTRNWDVQPRLQKSKDGGVTWSGGRNIALKTFQKGIPEMTPQDHIVSKLVKSYTYGWYGETTLSLGGTDVIAALVGSPMVFDANNPDLKIEIQEEKLQVQVKETKNGYEVSYNVNKEDTTIHRISVVQENAQLLKVIRLTPQDIELLHLFDRASIFPLEAKAQLTKLLAILGKKVTVMSPLLAQTENVKSKKGDTSLTVQIVPYGEVFTVRSFVKPLVDTPPYCTPGQGLEFIAANVKGETMQVARDLKAEKKRFKEMQSWMEPFDEYRTKDGWQMPVEECLGVLDLLREHTDSCRIEWPEGVKFAVRHPMINADKLHLSIKGVGHWFEMNGEVSIDDKTTLKISELLKRVREAKGHFIQIGDAEYVAISKDLQKQLSALDRVLQNEKKTLRLSEFNSSFIRDLELSGVSLSCDTNYESLRTRMQEADKLKIQVPKTLQAELRDYQLDGYRWMSRLAHWGAGACLADDMGLGKTVQTIALLLSRAHQGPSLVVMPTSVLINWQNELQRFAPTLNPLILRQATDRKAAIDSASNNDIVLVTYGLLPSEEELLSSKQWNVIVLDEAHTIKNKETKTSKVAMQLNADFRLLLTGTPLQNHLSEIWNLFQFATPGLLSDYKQFTQEFINPIERDQEKDPQRQLKKMLSPFILRRTKNEVLSELPEKTEITLKVELSDEERALYNHLREEAILNLEDGGRTSAIKALAEITKLRQVACNAALVLPAKEAKNIPSSKCETFMKLVDELMQNHHRALVFSQFTSHLALIEKELKHQGIEYQYLDGSVSPTERIRRVEDFQKGEHPLFLISLKAGGTGLNLTSADYVIHLDPWWNPSIEDQASDRAYRIGQDKPVTVYRLIASDTIEEKIIALHQTKKSLADALLEGSDMAHKLSTDEILALIRG